MTTAQLKRDCLISNLEYADCRNDLAGYIEALIDDAIEAGRDWEQTRFVVEFRQCEAPPNRLEEENSEPRWECVRVSAWEERREERGESQVARFEVRGK